MTVETYVEKSAAATIEDFVAVFEEAVGEEVHEEDMNMPAGSNVDIGNGLTVVQTDVRIFIGDGGRVVSVERSFSARLFLMSLFQIVHFQV